MGFLKWLLVKADWDAAYVNDLPDSAFLFIEPGGEKDDEGKTTPRSKRHLPYKDASGKVDEAHLNNALSRLGQDATGANWDGFDREAVEAKAKRIKSNMAKADDGAGAMESMAPAVLAAFYAAAEEYEVSTDGGFSLTPIADQDGDADGDGNTLFCVCCGGCDFYVLASGKSAEVVAYYCYEQGYAMYCSEDIERSMPEEVEADDDRSAFAVAIAAAAYGSKKKKPNAYKFLKADAEQQYTLGVAYPHDEVDAHGDFTDEPSLEQAAWNFMRSVVAKGEAGVGTDHADGTDGAATVVESYIYRGPDWTDEDGAVLAKTGDWLVGAVWSDEGWERVKKDELVGWSIQGLAFRVDEEESDG